MDLTLLRNEFESDDAASEAYHALRDSGGHVYVVGGAVRDAVLGKHPKDIDLMVTGLDALRIGQILKSLPGHVQFAGKNFGVFHYHYNGYQVEIAMPRTEVSTGSGHKDFAVVPDHTLDVQSDLKRRDFTANAMAWDIDSGRLIDPYNGSQDIREGNLRLVSPSSFEDDPLRVVRAIVSYAVHGLEPDEYTLDQMAKNADGIRHLPVERVQMELDKLLSGSDPAGAIELAYETGILHYICPELDQNFDFDQQNAHHNLNLGDHSLAVLNAVSRLTTDKDVRLAALLHDIGKPDSFWQDDNGDGHFYKNKDMPGTKDHAVVGAKMVSAFMNRMRYPNSRIQRVVDLVYHHMFAPFTTEKGARKFINRVGGAQMAKDLMTIREGDSQGKYDGQMDERDKVNLDIGHSLLDKVTSENQPTGIQSLAINGHDIMALGIQPGPQIKMILNDLNERVLEDPQVNNHDTLMQIVKENYVG